MKIFNECFCNIQTSLRISSLYVRKVKENYFFLFLFHKRVGGWSISNQILPSMKHLKFELLHYNWLQIFHFNFLLHIPLWNDNRRAKLFQKGHFYYFLCERKMRLFRVEIHTSEYIDHDDTYIFRLNDEPSTLKELKYADDYRKKQLR